DSSGTLYVGDSNRVRKVTSAGVVTTLAGSAGSFGNVDGTGTGAQFNDVSALAVDGAGNVLVVDNNANTVRMINTDGVVGTVGGVNQVAGNRDGTGDVATFSQPGGIAVVGHTYYIVDSGNNTIRKGVAPNHSTGDFDGDG